MQPQIDFDELCRLEPRLKALRDEAQRRTSSSLSRSCCIQDLWYKEFKPRLCQIVGWGRNQEAGFHVLAHVAVTLGGSANSVMGDKDIPVLFTPEAYQIAYRNIYDALPSCPVEDCQDCGTDEDE